MMWYHGGIDCRERPNHLVTVDGEPAAAEPEEEEKKPGKITRASLRRHYPDQE